MYANRAQTARLQRSSLCRESGNKVVLCKTYELRQTNLLVMAEWVPHTWWTFCIYTYISR